MARLHLACILTRSRNPSRPTIRITGNCSDYKCRLYIKVRNSFKNKNKSNFFFSYQSKIDDLATLPNYHG